MLNLTQQERDKITEIGKKFDLRFVILHGSYALGKERPDSDLDIALVGKQEIPSEVFFDLYGKLSDALAGQGIQDFDIKTLHHVDPFFRYLVVKDGILLYGNPTEYEEFKAFAFSDFMDSADLRRLELQMTLYKQKYLDQRYSSAA